MRFNARSYILLQKADNRYSASAGCNSLGGNFEISDNNRIKFTQGMSTMMACDHMEIETGLNRALVTADKIAFDGLYLNKKPTIIFDLSATKANGNSGCNNYNTTFTIHGNNIRFADPMSTKMACEGIGEDTFFAKR